MGIYENAVLSLVKATMVEHIVHIDGVTGSSPVATTREPNPEGFGSLHILSVGKCVRRTVPATHSFA